MSALETIVLLAGASGAGKSALASTLAHAPHASASRVDGVTTVLVSTARRRYAFVDAPAPEVPSWIARGAHGVVLVVAVEDSILPDTLHHVVTSKNAGLPIVAVVCTVRGDVDAEITELVQMEIGEMLAKWEIGPGTPSIAPGPGSLGALASALDAWDPMGR